MPTKGLGINVTDAGIGAILNQNLLMVPPNQRSYAWEESHVQTMFEDFSLAVSNSHQTYFLGTVVLTQGTGDRLEVADGQQRLATTSILIAAIRDYLGAVGPNEKKAAEKYTSDYLLIYDEMTGEHTPKLQLNVEDNDFFLNQILIPADQAKRQNTEPSVFSHRRLYRAATLARTHVENIVSQFNKADKAKELYGWVRFLRDSAMVISIRVPDHINAYTMFETLNDRGLRASQADILKNFLFGKSGDRLKEVQAKWSAMVSTIETVGNEDSLLTYIRHYWTLSNGYITERELASLVKEQVSGRQQAVSTVTGLEEHAGDYTGLLGPLEYNGWPAIDKQTRAYIYVITKILAIEQILPLLLAVIKKFQPSHARSAVKMFLSWSVRFLMAGVGGGGPLDRAYGQLAKEVTEGSIKTATKLREKVNPRILRTDDEFKLAFARASVSKTNLARYYLRSLELFKQDDPFADLGGTLDESFTFNVEHVMPQSESPDWNIDEEVGQQFRKRLGNMVLLNPDANVKLGSKSFSEKKKVYSASPVLLTQAVGKFKDWGPSEIDQRQSSLAGLAVKIWPS
jgi:hypothetical protein